MIDYYLIECDRPFISIGPDHRSLITWGTLKFAVEKNFYFVWDMMGEQRMIPHNTLEDAWREIQAYQKLLELGRAEGHPAGPWGFTRQQTEPLPPPSNSLPVTYLIR